MKIWAALILLLCLAGCGGNPPPIKIKSAASPKAELATIKWEMEEVQIPEDTSAYQPKNIESETGEEPVTTKKLELDTVKAEIKNSVMQITATASNVIGKPVLHFKGTVDDRGRFILRPEENFQDFNAMAVGECVQDFEEKTSRCQNFYADIYLRTEKEIFRRQLSLNLNIIDQCSSEESEFCGKQSEYVGIPIKLKNIPAPVKPTQPGSITPVAPPVASLPEEIFKSVEKVLYQSFGFYFTTYTKDKRPIYGRLENSETLATSEDFIKINVERNASFGTSSLVNLLKALNQQRALIYPGQKPVIGNLSIKNGGKMPCDSLDKSKCHESHQNGLDADVSYIISTNQPRGFSSVVNDGVVSNLFRANENWELLKWVNKNSDLNRVFVHPAIKKTFCSLAKEKGERDLEKDLLRKIIPDKVHNNHMHIRLNCQKADSLCLTQEAANSGC